jgi:hypothetical protein
MPSRKEIVERELGVKVPEQYADFLEKYGIYDPPGVEVYGISDKLLRYDGVPCVIGATEVYRRENSLPNRFLVIQHTGLEDEIVCLDTENEKIYAFSRVFGDRKIADSFNEWFERDIIEFHRPGRPNPYAGEKLHLIYDPNDPSDPNHGKPLTGEVIDFEAAKRRKRDNSPD